MGCMGMRLCLSLGMRTSSRLLLYDVLEVDVFELVARVMENLVK